MSARVRFPARLPDLLADDRDLLARFADRRDEGAFSALVKRHGGMVLGVCRRAVRDHQMAEDAFQAVFLVLARNPAAATRATSVAGWLFGVARRVGLAARRHELRRTKRERLASPGRQAGGNPNSDWDDLLRVLDEELAALPPEYRDPLLACFLREQTQDEAARQLGWSLSTLRRRLDRGKELLRARLTRRGATLCAGLFAGALAPSTARAVSRELAVATARAACGEALPSPVVNSLASTALGGAAVGKLIAVVGVLFVVVSGAGFALASRERTEQVPPVAHTPDAPALREPLTIAAPAPVRSWVTLKGRVVFPAKREVPKPLEVAKKFAIKDKDYCLSAGPLVFENALIDPKTRGIKNAVVWLRPDADDRAAPFPKDRIHPKLAAAKPRTHTVTVSCCQYEPRVTVARAGDRMAFENKSNIAHTVFYSPPVPAGAHDLDMSEAERVFNIVLLAGKTYAAEKPLPALRSPDHFKCSIHSWMGGYVWAFDHPYAAVTDADGNFTIPDAPPGTWRLVVWHEVAGYQTGRQKPLGRLVTIPAAKPVSDLGAIALDSVNWDELNKKE